MPGSTDTSPTAALAPAELPDPQLGAAATGLAMTAPQVPGDVADTHQHGSVSAGSVESADEKGAMHTNAISQRSADPEKAESPESSGIVDFDGPDDPAKAVNWSPKKKWSMIGCLSVMTFITPLASSMFAPGIPEVLEDFGSTSELLGAFCVSVYILGYAAGPIVVAPLSEMYGRLPIYHTTNVLFLIFTLACAVSSDLSMLIVFRFFAGACGSAPITMGGGTVADLFVQQERGGAMAIWSMGPLIGPVVGPIAGGFIAESIGWRWVFWIILIASGIVSAAYFVFVRETYSPAILQRKARKLRKQTGNKSLRAKGDNGESTLYLFKRSIVRPLKLLLLSPIVFLLSLYCAIVYGYLYLLFTTFPLVFSGVYGFGRGVVGLSYIGVGAGMFAGLFFVGALTDRVLKKKAAGGEMKPEYRLPFMVPGACVLPIGLFIYGWTTQYHVHWIVPIIATSSVGFGLLGIFMPTNTYLVDAFTLHAASALAANAILRSLLGALLPLAGPSLYARLGLGWGNSLLGFIAVALIGVPFAFLRWGEYLRTSPRFQLKL